jgi:hypothetical protein
MKLSTAGILIAIFVGLSNPDLGVKAGENQFFATWSIPTIFFINGVKIKAEEAKKAVTNVAALGWGSFCILFLSAVIGCQLSKVFYLLTIWKLIESCFNHCG